MNAGPHHTLRPHIVFRLQNGRSRLVVIRGILEGLHQASPERLARFASFLFALVVWSSALSAAEPVIHGASLGPEAMYTQGNGDTWYATWADDGHLYVTSDDTTGFSGNCVGKERSQSVFVAVSRLRGTDPAHLTGETVNCLNDYNVPPDPKHDTSWKTTGITSVSGTLYLIVEQDTYEDASNKGRETARNATILKSVDHGNSWSGSERESVAHPMFPGTRFGAPSFIQYGQDGSGGVDGGDTYVYAMSNEGAWDNTDSIVLGRVLRSSLPRLRGEDWEFYANGGWSPDLREALPVLRESNHLASASIMYVPALHTYILASWYYPGCHGYSAPGCDVHRTRWVWYQAPKPWGPWTKFWEPEWFPAGYYNPILVSKFLSSDGMSGWVFSAGYFWERSWYHLVAAPFMLDLAPHVVINDSDLKAIAYEGQWNYTSAGLGEYGGDLHYTMDPNASAKLRFRGSGVRVLTDFAKDRGTVDIYLDGRFQATVSAHHDSAQGNTQLTQRVLWSIQNLGPGEHTLQMRKRDGVYMTVDAFVVTRSP